MNKKQPLVSIIIPNFNTAEYIGDCLDSCIKQTYRNIEIIVVDDCSSDTSIQIIKSFQKKDDRIKLIQNEINLMVSRTRHNGIINCNSDWITTLDSDDFYFTTEKIEREVEILAKYNFNKYIIACSDTIVTDQNGKFRKNMMMKSKTKEGFILDGVITRTCAIPRDFIFSKNLYFEVGSFNFNIPIYEDWDLKIRLAKKAQYYFTGHAGTGYRQHDSGLSSAKREEHLKWIKHVFSINSQDLERKNELRVLLDKRLKKSILRTLKRKVSYSLGKYKIFNRFQ